MTAENKFNPEAYCWRGEAVARHESLWSLLHKFAAFNSADSSAVKKTLAIDRFKNEHFDYFWKWKNRADLRDFGALDPSVLTRAFHLTRRELDKSVVSIYMNPQESRWLTCDELRYCDDCLKLGFHSVIYQMLFLSNCPIHEEKAFRTGCENCGAKIPYYLNAKTFKYPYCCSKCNRSLTSLFDDPRKKLDMKGSDEVLRSVHRWLLSRKKLNLVDRMIPRHEPSVFDVAGVEAESLYSNLVHHWSDMTSPSNDVSEYLKRQTVSEDLKHSYVRYKVSQTKCSTPEEPVVFDKDLHSIYKAIRRSLIRTTLGDHQRCIEKYGRSLYWDKFATTCDGRICVEANAYILWRMYFEQIDHPVFLFKKYRPTPIYVHERASIFWNRPPREIPDFILKKIFSLECYWIFSECRTLARHFNSNDVYSLNPRYVKGYEVPHWIVENDGKTIQINWWKRPKNISAGVNLGQCVLK